MKKTNHKAAAVLYVILVAAYFIFINQEIESRYTAKLGFCLLLIPLYYFFVYFNNKRKRGNHSYISETIACAVGWLVYFLLLNLFPTQRFLTFAFGFQVLFSAYLSLVFLAKIMLKITGEDDRF
ncbi:hypothetical protein [uncultured Roseibium sp.]|uniref:hypothetical protein n=1 Tax=uncultured Roseibium sp. TaxID=1936171 RepID=UPI0026345AFE|nr:hypothetical protein [uncultured Roseibium sp.]